MAKKEEQVTKPTVQPVSVKDPPPPHSMAMPSLLYRTGEITKRVLEHNHGVPSKPESTPPVLNEVIPPQPSPEPMWLVKRM